MSHVEVQYNVVRAVRRTNVGQKCEKFFKKKKKENDCNIGNIFQISSSLSLALSVFCRYHEIARATPVFVVHVLLNILFHK